MARILALVMILILVMSIGCGSSPIAKPDQSDTLNQDKHQTVRKSKVIDESTAKSVTPPEEVVAKVNNVVITKQRLKKLIEAQVKVYRDKKKKIAPKLKQLYRRASLMKLIDQELLTQYISRLNITLTHEEKIKAFNKYKSRFSGAKSFQKYLQSSGKNENEIRKTVEFEATIMKATRLKYKEDFDIKDRDIKDFYDKHREYSFTKPERVRVSHLLVTAPRGSGKRSIRKQKKVAEKLYMQARNMKASEFADLVRQHSADLTTREQGGDLNYFERKGVPMISDHFAKKVAKLKVNEVSDPILTSKGYHIVKLTDRQASQVRVSHILLDPKNTTKHAREIRKRFATENFAQLAKEFSVDEITRLRGGELGFVLAHKPHHYGEAFKKACLEGKEGSLIGPISTSKGKHLIYVKDRRPERLRASHILIKLPLDSKPSQKKEALAKIMKVSKLLKEKSNVSLSFFVRLVRKYSEGPNRNRGGDLGRFYLDGNPKISHTFEKAAFAGKVNKVLPPILSPHGWHIIFVHDHQKHFEQPFNEVKKEIRERILNKVSLRTKSRLIKVLRNKAKIESEFHPNKQIKSKSTNKTEKR